MPTAAESSSNKPRKKEDLLPKVNKSLRHSRNRSHSNNLSSSNNRSSLSGIPKLSRIRNNVIISIINQIRKMSMRNAFKEPTKQNASRATKRRRKQECDVKVLLRNKKKAKIKTKRAKDTKVYSEMLWHILLSLYV